jgi:hypothetical protein
MPSPTLRSLVLIVGTSSTIACAGSVGSPEPPQPVPEQTATSQQALWGPPPTFAAALGNLDAPIAGVAGTDDVVFVGEPLNGTVVVLSTITGQQIAQLTPPPEGFAIPFIMHIVGPNKLTILGAGGLPQPAPFMPANPFLYEYAFNYDHHSGFSATLVRQASFSSVLIGFSEDFVHLDDGRYLVSDSVLGSIWILEPDGTVNPGIVPQSFEDPSDFIPLLAFCPTMPEVTVNGYPFLFTGSTLPGVSPLAVRNGTVYYYSPCARGIYSFPLSILTDHRQPYQRASSISLVAATPAWIEVEELLDFQFNPYDPFDNHLYAAQGLQMSVIRVDVSNGNREVLATGPTLFDFPSSLGFLPPVFGVNRLVVASNQQERSPITNDAVTQTTFNLPFIVGEVSFFGP